MDFLSAGLGIVGLGMQIFGGISGSQDAQRQAEISGQISQQEQAINAQKQTQMQLSARRQDLEIFRQTQRARAQSEAVATNQGAQFGSGLQGGLGQVQSQGMFNAAGINQNLEIGQNIFAANNQISGLRAQSAQVSSDQAFDQGIASLGGSVVRAGPIIGAFGRNIYGSNSNA